MYQLDENELERVLEIGTLDPGNGNLFGNRMKRSASHRNLMIIIGIGGSGMAAVKKIKKSAEEKLEEQYSLYTRFLVIDSATCELKSLAEQEIDILNISSPGLDKRMMSRSAFYKNMVAADFPVNELFHITDNGSGARRQIGRVKLYDTSDNGEETNDQRLSNKIRGYFREWSAFPVRSVDIVIVTGLGGGTGSGIFLDVASIARASCPSPNMATVYGYLMLPDCMSYRTSDYSRIQILHANAYSALKELENLEGLGDEIVERREIIRTNGGKDSILLNWFSRPFDYPFLISGRYEEAVSTIAETVIDFMTGSAGAYDPRAFFSQGAIALAQRRGIWENSVGGMLKAGACPEESYKYCGAGYDYASIPEKVVIPYIVGNVAKRLYVPDESLTEETDRETYFCSRDRALSRTEFENAMREFLSMTSDEALDAKSLWRRIIQIMIPICRIKESTVPITFEEVVDGRIGEYMHGFNLPTCISEARKETESCLQHELDTMKDRARGVMQKYGPRVLSCLYTGQGNPGEDGRPEDYSSVSLREMIETVAAELIKVSSETVRMPAMMPGRINPFLRRLYENRYLEEWKNSVTDCQRRTVRCEIARMMCGENGMWRALYERPFLRFLSSVERFADTFERLSYFYAEEGKSLNTDDFHDFAGNCNDVRGKNLCTDHSAYTWVKEIINQKLHSINIQDVIDNLINSFYENTEGWCSNETGKARTCYDEVMSRSCGVGKYASMPFVQQLSVAGYFQNVLSDIPRNNQLQVINNLVRSIYDRLTAYEEPAYSSPAANESAVLNVVCLPQCLANWAGGPMIYTAFAALNGNYVFYSPYTEAIECYQFSAFNALSSVRNLAVWEKDYYGILDSTMHSTNPETPLLHMKTGFSQYKELTRDETAAALGENRKSEPLPYFAQQTGGAPAAEELNRMYGTGLSWEHYPDISIRSYGDDFADGAGNGESKYQSDLFTKRVNEALRIGLIEWEQTGSVYKCFLNTIPSDWTNLDTQEYTKKDVQTNRYARGKVLFDFLQDKNPGGITEYREQIALQNPNFFGTQGFDFHVIMEREGWTEEKAAVVRKAYMMRILRKSTELYQRMEDTMYRFYSVEYDLERRELAGMDRK